jgi:hypothetical protein
LAHKELKVRQEYLEEEDQQALEVLQALLEVQVHKVLKVRWDLHQDQLVIIIMFVRVTMSEVFVVVLILLVYINKLHFMIYITTSI